MDIDKLKIIVKEIEKTMPCTCDLDKWEPTKITGHSQVCGIHKKVMAEIRTK